MKRLSSGGIGGLTTALMLCARGIGCELFEQSDTIRELGVGINTLPHAIRELAASGYCKSSTTSRSAPTSFIISTATARKSGANPAVSMPVTTCRNSRFIAAAAEVIHRAVEERLGRDAIHTGCRLGAFTQDEGGVSAHFFDRAGSHTRTVRGDI